MSTSTSSPNGTHAWGLSRSATGAWRTSSFEPSRNGANWRAAVAESGLDAGAYLYRDRTQDAFLPLADHRRHDEVHVLPRGTEKSLRAEWTSSPRRRSASEQALKCRGLNQNFKLQT